MIIPLECEFFALRGVALLDTIDKVQERLNPKLEIDGVLGTMYDCRTLHSREVMQRLVEACGDTVFQTVIRRTVKFSETTVAGEPITTWAPTSVGRRGLPRARQGGAGPVTRRVSLPGAGRPVPPHRQPETRRAPPRGRAREIGEAAARARPRRSSRAEPAATAADVQRPRAGTTRRSPSTSPRTSCSPWSTRGSRCAATTAWPPTAAGSSARRSPIALADLEASGDDPSWCSG